MYICFRARCTFACERGKGRRREFFRNLSQTVKKTHVFLTSFLFSLSLSPPHLSTQVHVKAGKADEAGEALKVVKAPKVSWQFRSEKSLFFLLPLRPLSLAPLTSFLSLSLSLSLPPTHLSTQVHEAGEALKVFKVPKAPKVSWQFR